MAGLDTSQTPCPIGGEVNPKRLSVLISHHRLVMRSHLNCRMGHALKARVWARSGGVLVHKLSRAPAERLCRSSIDTQSQQPTREGSLVGYDTCFRTSADRRSPAVSAISVRDTIPQHPPGLSTTGTRRMRLSSILRQQSSTEASWSTVTQGVDMHSLAIISTGFFRSATCAARNVPVCDHSDRLAWNRCSRTPQSCSTMSRAKSGKPGVRRAYSRV